MWPVPITVCFAGEGFETSLPPLPRFHTRLSTQKPWVEVISSLAEVHKRLFVREPAEYGPYTWPRSTPIAQAALATIRTMCIDDYRLHVQVWV